MRIKRGLEDVSWCPPDHTRAKVQDSIVEEFPWGLSVMKRSFLHIHECMGRIWACGCLNGMFWGMRGFRSMFHDEIIRPKRGIREKGSLVSSKMKVT